MKHLRNFLKRITTTRGVQYVHCVMHKCIMVKVGGIHVKYVKTRKFYEIRGETFCKSRGKEKFFEIGENELKQGGNSKRSSETLADENRKFFLGKGEIGEIFHGVRIFFGNKGNPKQRGKCIIASGGMDAP